jgi:hypothetical protein
VTWQPGRARVAELLEARELEQITPDPAVVQFLLDDAGRHLATADTASASGDFSGGYQLAYDALRKSAASLLAAQGLRATSRGGHVALQEAVVAQFGTTVRALRSFARIRRARNTFEYPSTLAPGPSAEDVSDAITTATHVRDAAITILQQNLLTTW